MVALRSKFVVGLGTQVGGPVTPGEVASQHRERKTVNYAEELVYWYLRLNGFFVIQNFVLHDTENPGRASDWDTIGLRHPHVYEEIGGQPDDVDPGLTAVLPLNKVTGVLCEVK